jgi:hypothetical protein
MDDRILLRGWIKHIEWTQLESQLPEAGAFSRKKINFTVRTHRSRTLNEAAKY